MYFDNYLGRGCPAQLQNILAFYSDFHVNYEEIYGIGHYESFERKKWNFFPKISS